MNCCVCVCVCTERNCLECVSHFMNNWIFVREILFRKIFGWRVFYRWFLLDCNSLSMSINGVQPISAISSNKMTRFGAIVKCCPFYERRPVISHIINMTYISFRCRLFLCHCWHIILYLAFVASANKQKLNAFFGICRHIVCATKFMLMIWHLNTFVHHTNSIQMNVFDVVIISILLDGGSDTAVDNHIWSRQANCLWFA